jgi:hypothetical protein
MGHHYCRQAFRRGTGGYRLDSTPEEQENHHANVWGWNGNSVAPTLRPSFLVKPEFGVPYRLHCFIRNGQIDLCADSTVTLHPNPKPCRDLPIARPKAVRKVVRTRARKPRKKARRQ